MIIREIQQLTVKPLIKINLTRSTPKESFGQADRLSAYAKVLANKFDAVG